MIRLYDWPSQETFDLDYSLNQAGFSGPAVVINDHGFLPQNMESPYGYFCGMLSQKGRPLYFNQVPVPEFWQIAGNNLQAEVLDGEVKRASIFYIEPKQERRVKNVDWLDRKGKVRFTDHFNQWGLRFAQTAFDASQTVTLKTYYNAAGQEIIVENFKTGDIILNWQNSQYFFKNRVEFLAFYFQERQFDTDAIWYNSLSTPFFVSRYLANRTAQKDILFWQEEITDEIPGNMRLIFEQPNENTQQVIVQKYRTYQRLLDLLPLQHHDKVHYLGYIYPIAKSAKDRHKAFILTNSDQIEGLQTLVEQLPQLDFHIAAYTEMSPRLLAFEDQANVSLYPNSTRKLVLEKFKDCGLYLDINHYNEVDHSIRQAFEEGALILSFANTVHQPDFLAPQHIFEQPDQMVSCLQELLAEPASFQKMLTNQQEEAEVTDSQAYQERLATQDDRPFANVLGILETCQLIREKQLSVVRFGDGEIDIMAGHSIPYQTYHEDLAKRLKAIITRPSNDHLLVCLPDVFRDLQRYTPSARHFWEKHLQHYKTLYQGLIQSDWYGTTFLSRPYIDLQDKKASPQYFAALKQLWQDQQLLIVEGVTSRSGVGNDLFAKAKAIKRIICPSHHAYSRYEDIKKAVQQHAKDHLILLMLGPTAKVLAADLSEQGFQAIDIGHIDSEYEWFQLGVDHKVKLGHKHTAEFNYDEGIILAEDQAYQSQIVTVID
ncbi:accessory Sec system glycosylation chaperone GtfB [Streptococcus halichoeri]|uniref:accessory Sec system glycosylation chaperone GtfB n=1 Tax=Streptococcus halichoeri TaxID=254785 RepID=UPI001917A234|nr:accessory Sec system glycosylation chaperone GtfB [Streptococcus halichoeri]